MLSTLSLDGFTHLLLHVTYHLCAGADLHPRCPTLRAPGLNGHLSQTRPLDILLQLKPSISQSKLLSELAPTAVYELQLWPIGVISTLPPSATRILRAPGLFLVQQPAPSPAGRALHVQLPTTVDKLRGRTYRQKREDSGAGSGKTRVSYPDSDTSVWF